jgi:hypothetical protein
MATQPKDRTPRKRKPETTLTERVRSMVRLKVGIASAMGAGLRSVGQQTKVSPATLSRFLHGHPCNSDVLDRLAAWVNFYALLAVPAGEQEGE